MSSHKKVEVEVKTNIGGGDFAFFTNDEFGDIFIHGKVLRRSGFENDAMVSGHPAVVDMEERQGKFRVLKVHTINNKSGKKHEAADSRAPRHNKPAYVNKFEHQPGMYGKGEVKVLKEGYGFLKCQGFKDLFFPMVRVPEILQPFMEVGVQVEFEVLEGQRGVQADITNVVWSKDQIVRNPSPVDHHEDKFVFRMSLPTGQSWYEVRVGGVDGELLDETFCLGRAREMIGKTISSPAPKNQGKKTNDPTLSQSMKGSSSGGKKKVA